MAATRALAMLAREPVPESVAARYGLKRVTFGRDYLIPFPFDPRVLLWIAPAVAWAAVASGVAKEFIEIDSYRDQLEARQGRARGILRGIIHRATSDPKRVVLAEGEHRKSIRAARILVDDGIAFPILLGNPELIARKAAEENVSLDDIEIEDPAAASPRREEFTNYLWERRQRKGMSHAEASRRLYNPNYYGCVMVATGAADAMISGATTTYPETLRPALEVIGANPRAGLVSGMYMLVFERQVVFCADTTVNFQPTAQQLAQIGYAASRIVRALGEVPRVAMLSFSNFGSVRGEESTRVAQAVELLRQRDPKLMVDGEMQADTAVSAATLTESFPFSALKEPANVLIFPNLSAGNIAYKLLHHLGGATAIGPILIGMAKPVHLLEQGADVQDIVNMAAVAVMDAQDRVRPTVERPAAAAQENPDKDFGTVITLADLGGGRTRVTLTSLFKDEAARELVVREYGAVEGGVQHLQKLAKHVEQMPGTFVIARTFDAPRALVWKAFTDPARLATWWGPPGTTLRHSSLDLRPGGRYHFHSVFPDGKSVWGLFVYREVSPIDRIVYLHSFSDEAGGVAPSPFGGPWPAQLHTTMLFAEKDGTTEFTLRQFPIGASPDEEAAFTALFEGMAQGWGGTLDQLAGYLAAARA
jgi:phosphate acetyltransferase